MRCPDSLGLLGMPGAARSTIVTDPVTAFTGGAIMERIDPPKTTAATMAVSILTVEAECVAQVAGDFQTSAGASRKYGAGKRTNTLTMRILP